VGELEILLVTSRTRRRWIIPKGWPIKGLRPDESAAREAFEEAGVRGPVRSRPIGRFLYSKLMDDEGKAILCEVEVFPLSVNRQYKEWPEMRQREVRWVAAGTAAAATDEDGLRPLLQAFAEKMMVKKKWQSQKVHNANQIDTQRPSENLPFASCEGRDS